MARLTSFTNITLDGFFADENADMQFFHKRDSEWSAFTAENAKGGGALLFGRKTYEMMASYWPTPVARERTPVVAKMMNECPKFVASRTLGEASWQNTRVLAGDLETEIRKLKEGSSSDVAILGSGSIVAELAAAGLIDEMTVAVHPLVLGKGKALFAGVETRFSLTLAKTRTFQNGVVVLTYASARL
jgi:dihydrofolate reductase